MFERFSEVSRRVMEYARQEAQRFNYEWIGTEHILLGLLKGGSDVVANVFKNLDVDIKKLRLEVEKLVNIKPDLVAMGKLPQTPRAKKVIEYAIEEARACNHAYVGTGHILLGLLREEDGKAFQALMNLGLQIETVRREVLTLQGEEEPLIEKDTTGSEERLVLSITMGKYAPEDEVVEGIVNFYKALTAYHIACGGSGLTIDDWQTFVGDNVPQEVLS